MKSLRVLVLSGVLSVGVAGCGAWWQELRTNPVAALQEGSHYISVALTLATAAFNAFSGGLPPETVAQFHRIEAGVAGGLLVANDGLRVAEHASASPPDVNALLADARAAMGDMAAFLAGLRQPAPAVGRRLSPSAEVLEEAIAASQRASLRYP